ncbi:MAG: NADH:flavin oxidoreductase [Fibrobacteres bacterium]|nr:NADH:flavin oxidoreductase [Fibrobacterota bacterium]
MQADIKRITSIKSPASFRERMVELGLDLPIEDSIQKAPDSPLAQSLDVAGFRIGNRWAIHPMEGWDATSNGRPTPDLIRRWRRFGESGAKLLWGMEAIAIRADGRANPNQLLANPSTMAELAEAAHQALEAHARSFGTAADVLWGFQLTHSGRFCRPRDKEKLEPKLAYAHPILNPKFGLPMDYPVLSDDDVKDLVEHYVEAARLADQAGVPFVDIKQCHGYLGHEFLSAFTRKGKYGGETLEERSTFAREIIAGIRQVAPRLILGVRVSAFDFVPFKPDPVLANGGNLGPGTPEDYSACLPYKYGFGVDRENPVQYDLAETAQYLALLKAWGVAIVNISAGSPYYNPHIQRPALFPPSDGYQPAEDPIINVERQIQAVRKLKAAVPDMPLVSSGLTYLQEYMPQVAQALVRQGWTDFAGMGRMVLSYPRIIADSLEKGSLETKAICRTFSDCTTAPRNGIKSGCYPLDEYYRKRDEGEQLRKLKKDLKEKFKQVQEPKEVA